MNVMPHLQSLLDQVDDPGAALRLILHNGPFRLEAQARREALLRTARNSLGFFARPPGHEAKGLLLGRRADTRVPITFWARDKERASIEQFVHPGDILFAVGLEPSFDLRTAKETCDVSDLLSYDLRPEVETFVREVLRRTISTYDDSRHATEVALVSGSLVMARTLLEANDPLRRGVEFWALRHRLVHLDLEAILDDERWAGNDPTGRIELRERHNPEDVNRQALQHAFERLKTLDAPQGRRDDGLWIAQRILQEHVPFLLNHPEVIGWVCTLEGFSSQEQQRITARAGELLASPLFERICKPEGVAGYVMTLERLGARGFWNGLDHAHVETGLVDLMAAGDFDNVYGFLRAMQDSAFTCKLRIREPDDPEGSDRPSRHIDEIRAYLAGLLPRVHARAMATGRLDVARFLRERCPKEVLDIPRDSLCDLMNASQRTIPTGARIHEEGLPRILFTHSIPSES